MSGRCQTKTTTLIQQYVHVETKIKERNNTNINKKQTNKQLKQTIHGLSCLPVHTPQ